MLVNKVYNNLQAISYSTADVLRPNAFLISFEEFKDGGSGLFK